jgi:hypothetical protein
VIVVTTGKMRRAKPGPPVAEKSRNDAPGSNCGAYDDKKPAND